MKCVVLLLAMILSATPTLAASPVIQESSGCIKTSWLSCDKKEDALTVTYCFTLDVRNSCDTTGLVNINIVGTDALGHEVDSFIMTSQLKPWQKLTMTDKIPLPAGKNLFINRWDIQSVNFYYMTPGQL